MCGRKRSPGRPLKYGRPARLLQLTLPEDVIEWLLRIHEDPGWAIVNVCERTNGTAHSPAAGVARLVELPESGGLIAFKPATLRAIKGVSAIPFSDDWALVAMQEGQGIADLELAIIEALESGGLSAEERDELRCVRETLRDLRRRSAVRFHSKSIIVVHSSRGPLLEEARRGAKKAGDRKRARASLRSIQLCCHGFGMYAVEVLRDLAERATLIA